MAARLLSGGAAAPCASTRPRETPLPTACSEGHHFSRTAAVGSMSPLLFPSAGLPTDVHCPPAAAGAANVNATSPYLQQGHQTSLILPSSCCSSAAASPPPPFDPAPRYCVQPSAAATDGAAARWAVAGAADGGAPAFVGSPTRLHHRSPFPNTNAPTAVLTGAHLYPVGMTLQQQPPPSAAGQTVERRKETQRPLHRAHPYGSSLLGRLINRISTSLTSLSSFVPGASAVSSQPTQKEADAAIADDVAGARNVESVAEGGRLQKGPHTSPLQAPAADGGLPFKAANAFPLYKLGAPIAALRVGPASPAAASYANVAAAAAQTDILHQSMENRATDTRGEAFWLSEQHLLLPYTQVRPAAAPASAAAADSTTGRDFFLGEQSSSSSYNLQLLEQQQQGKRLKQEKQQKTGANDAVLYGRAAADADVRPSHRHLGSIAIAAAPRRDEYEMRDHAYFPSEKSTASEGGGRTGERREAAAGAAAVPSASPHGFYGVPRERMLAESCFGRAGNAAANADVVSYRDGYWPVRPQQQHHELLRRGLICREAAEEQAAERFFLYDGCYTAPSRATATETGGLLREERGGGEEQVAREKRFEPLPQQRQQRFSKQHPLQQDEGMFLRGLMTASALPTTGTQSQQSQVEVQPEQGVVASGRKVLFGRGKERSAGVSLSRESSSRFPCALTEEGSTTQQGRRRQQRGYGGSSASLFSEVVAPAWLSSAEPDLLDVEATALEAAHAAAAFATRSEKATAASTRAGATRSNAQNTRTNTTTKKAAYGGRSPHLYPHQEQLTVEQLQKLYLRCQPLRWRVRLRDLFREEAIAAAAAAPAATKMKAVAVTGDKLSSAATSPNTIASSSAAADEKSFASVETRKEVGEKKSSTLSGTETCTQGEEVQFGEEGGQRVLPEGAVVGRGGESLVEATHISRQEGWNAASAGEYEEGGQQHTAAGALHRASSAAGSLAGSSSARRHEIHHAEEMTFKKQERVSTSAGQVAGAKSVVGGYTVAERKGEEGSTPNGQSAMMTREFAASVRLLGSAAPCSAGEAGGKGSKVNGSSSSEKEEEGKSGGDREAVKTVRLASGGDVGGAAVRSTALFGSGSRRSSVERSCLVSAGGEGGDAVTKAGRLTGGEQSLGSSSREATTGVKADGSVCTTPLLGGAGSSLFKGGATAAGTQQHSNSGGGGSSLGKFAAASYGDFTTTPASSLFGGARSSSGMIPRPLLQHPAAAAADQASVSTQLHGEKQGEAEQIHDKDLSSGIRAAVTKAIEKGAPDTAATKTAAAGAASAAAAATKPAEAAPALPWWQQNLSKPCTVMPEEDFAPEANDEEEAAEDATARAAAEKELPPLKMPNIFGNSSSSDARGLFGSAATGSSLFKTAAEPSPLFPARTSAAQPAAPTPTASLFGSAGSGNGLWSSSTKTTGGLFSGLQPSTTTAAAATSTQPGTLFGGQSIEKQGFSQLSSATPVAATARIDAPSSSATSKSGATGEETKPTSLFGDLSTNSTGFVTQKSAASLFGGSIFGNPVARGQGTQADGSLGGTAAAAGLFVFGSGAGSSTPPPSAAPVAAKPAAPVGPSLQASSSGSSPPAVPSLIETSFQRPQQSSSSSSTGKRSRDDSGGSGGTATAPAAKNLFGAPPSSSVGAVGGGQTLFAQAPPLAGGGTIFGGATAGSGGLFKTGNIATRGNNEVTAEKAAGAITGSGSGGLFGGSGNSRAAPGSLFGVARSATPVFGSNNSSSSNTSGDAARSATSNSVRDSFGAGVGSSAVTGNTLGLFGSNSTSSTINPFGFAGNTGRPSEAAVSLFGGSGTKLPDGTRGLAATAESNLVAAPPLWAGKGGVSTSSQGLFSTAGNAASGETSAGGSDGSAAATMTSNGVLQPPRGLFGDAAAGSSTSSALGIFGAKSTVQGNTSSAAPTSIFGNVSAAPAITFAATSAIPTTQQQQLQKPAVSPPPAIPAPSGGEAGGGSNAFFGALPPGVRRPRLTIKRTKQ